MSPIRNIDHTVPDSYALAFSAPMMASVSTVSLIIGVASAQAMHADILIAGFGLAAVQEPCLWLPVKPSGASTESRIQHRQCALNS